MVLKQLIFPFPWESVFPTFYIISLAAEKRPAFSHALPSPHPTPGREMAIGVEKDWQRSDNIEECIYEGG